MIHFWSQDHDPRLSQQLIPNPALLRVVALARQCVILSDRYNTLFASAREPDADEDGVGSAMA